MTAEEIAALSVDELREQLPDVVAAQLLVADDVRASVATGIRSIFLGATSDELVLLQQEYLELGSEYRAYLAIPLVRRLVRAFTAVLIKEATIDGLSLLEGALAQGPCLLVGNHLSYADTQLKDAILTRNGAQSVADRLTTVAGPKVYEDSLRRLASFGLNTIKTAQSARLSSNEVVLSKREVARVAVGTIRTARDLMRRGYPVLLYGEGSRSRTGRLGPFLRAVSRYAGLEGIQLVPVAIAGSDEVMPIHENRARPRPVHVAFGAPVPGGPDRAVAALETAWHSLAALLPERHQPEPGTRPLR